MDKEGLADFLRRRRATLRPGDVGLPDGPRRRTRGLRREEVAGLAGMSTDYYTRLEQRRGPQPSEQIAAALARALRLTLDERDHLFGLIGHSAPARFLRSEHVGPALMRVLDRLDDTPALVLSDLADTLAQNPLAVALLGDQTRHTGLARSAYYRWFTDPAERTHYPEEDHPRQSRIQAAALRAALTADSGNPRAARIVAELRERSAEFVRVWDRHEVAKRFEDHKTLVHPELGRIEVDCQVLFADNSAQTLLVMTTRPGTESHGKLQLLSVIGHQQFTH
ncbi:helix-turn-helix domain-containing protein [Streptomyces sp. NPDC091212]|uniref:MmyB family transcriptional regulator n=1 Tax=Streptomyces sp. NPDC091212 TaxID=3155191 RepID=UPI00341F0744